uniref:Polyphenol oxidase n=1 Tax=Sinopodophyllum hexandrum TaxID=93608 RepID=A0A0N9HQF2_SINHE|nr:polyphenol oxidase [Sinopodophyllum hexandrum]
MSLSLLATTIPSAGCCNRLGKPKNQHQLVHVSKRIAYTSCEQKSSQERDVHVTDRRNLLLGLGGLYGATATMGSQGMVANGAPIEPPDLSTCHSATVDGKSVSCCPPYSSANIIDFVPPSATEALRVRKPAHKLTSEELSKFKEAIRLMKALPADDPWNFMQQATIHCTYCNGAYDQLGYDPAVTLQIHGSWLFLPWHRYYLHFWERILGKLIGDPTFTIPFWNWDTPDGMYMPEIYKDTSSPLYNANRDQNHLNAMVDYKFAYTDPIPTTPTQISEATTRNLCQINQMFKETKNSPSLFMGKAVRAGEAVPSTASGNLESLHNTFHQWTGPQQSPYYDMGSFYTAARDCIFFAHHANIDRFWDLYSGFRGYKLEFKDKDWLDSSFIFYDENRQVVKVKVKDCLKTQDLRFTYSSEKLQWKDISKKCKKVKAKTKSAGVSVQLNPVDEFGSQPRVLTENIRAIVTRPKISRTKDEKEDATEVILIDGIQVAHGEPARFDVYVTKPIEGLVGPDLGDLAGSFVKVPHTHGAKDNQSEQSSGLELGINNLLEEIEAEDSDKLVVTLVPRMGEVTVGGVRVDLFEVEDDD